MKLQNYSPEYINIDEELICGSIMQNVSTDTMDTNLLEFSRNLFRVLSKRLQEPYKTQMVLLWLRFEKNMAKKSSETDFSANTVKSDKKARTKLIKNEIKTIMDQDRENIDIYCAYADFISIIEGYKNSSKIYKALLQSRCQIRGVAQNKASAKIYICSIINELKELKRIKENKRNSDDNSLHQALNLHLINAQWLLHLMTEKIGYKDCSISNRSEMKDLVERSGQKNSNWIHKQLAGKISELIHGSQNGNDNPESMPVLCYNEFVSRIFIQVWLLYFETGNTVESVDFVHFVRNKAQQKVNQEKDDRVNYLIEMLYKIVVDLLLYDGAINSVQSGQSVLAAAMKDYPCNYYLLRTGILNNKFNIQTNVTSSIWKSITTSMMENKIPCQSFVISVLIRLLLDKFLNIQQRTNSNQPFDFKSLTRYDDISVGHLNQAQSLLDRFLRNNRNEQIASPVIWRLLLWITRARHEINPAKYSLANVKTIFYRACQDNPGAKVFFLDTMNYCESATKTDIIDMKGKYVRKKFRNTSKAVRETQTELQNLMTEKEIHVRIPMEELQVILEPEDTDL